MIAAKNTALRSLLVMLTLFIVFSLSACQSTKGPEKVTLADGQTAFQVKGMVKKIARRTNLLTIKPPKADEITFKVLETTAYEDTDSFKSIKKDSGVLVTYTTGNDGNTALIIKQLPDGSCGR